MQQKSLLQKNVSFVDKKKQEEEKSDITNFNSMNTLE